MWDNKIVEAVQDKVAEFISKDKDMEGSYTRTFFNFVENLLQQQKEYDSSQSMYRMIVISCNSQRSKLKHVLITYLKMK